MTPKKLQEIEFDLQQIESGASGPFAKIPSTDVRALLDHADDLGDDNAILERRLQESEEEVTELEKERDTLRTVAGKLAEVVRALPKGIKLNELYYPPMHERRIRFGPIPKEITELNEKKVTPADEALAAYDALK